MGNINDVSKHMTTLFSYNKKWLMLYDTYIHIMYDQHNKKVLYIFPPSLSQDESKNFNMYFVS